MNKTGPTKNRSCQKIIGTLKVREYKFIVSLFEFISKKKGGIVTAQLIKLIYAFLYSDQKSFQSSNDCCFGISL